MENRESLSGAVREAAKRYTYLFSQASRNGTVFCLFHRASSPHLLSSRYNIARVLRMHTVNLFLIGVNKAGTSWLYYLLDQHPGIFMSDIKELYFFGDFDENGPDTLEAYHTHFPFEEAYQYFGEATVMYYRSEQAAREIHAYNSNAKLLAIVRDPIQRLLSQYRYHKQLGILDEETTLEEALDGRDPRLLRDSHYEDTLPVFTNQFGNDRVKIISLEESRQNPKSLWNDLLDFLNLSHLPLPSMDDRPENPTGSSGFRRIYRMLIPPIRKRLPGAYRWMLKSTVIRQAKLGLLRLLGTAEKNPLSSKFRDRLCNEFAPTYTYLRQLGFSVYDTQRECRHLAQHE
jgi:hypothetical protein